MKLGKYLSSLIKPELEELIENCGFTDEEIEIFVYLSKGRMREEISQLLKISSRTVDRRIKSIKNKMLKIGKYKNGGIENERSSNL